MDFSIYISRLNEVTGLNLVLDKNNAVVFDYQKRQVLLRFFPDLDSYLVYIQLLRLNNAARLTLEKLLEANFLLSDTHGGAFSWAKDEQMVGMNFLLHLPEKSPNPELFINQLNHILEVADHWYAQISVWNNQNLDAAAKRLTDLRAGRNPALQAASQDLASDQNLWEHMSSPIIKG